MLRSRKLSPDRREARDRWRIGFPEYDRYGDRGARGRDIPFKKGRWWDPYNQSVLKGRLSDQGQQALHDPLGGEHDHRRTAARADTF